MRNKLVALALLAGGMALACTESVGPPLDPLEHEPGIIETRAFRPLKWNEALGPLQFVVSNIVDDDEDVDDDDDRQGSPQADPPVLDNYEVSFWAVKNETRGVLINWLETSGDTTIAHPYLEFIVPANALDRAPDGEQYEEDDAVRITITIDTTDMIAHFGPSGLTFKESNPAELQYWYTGSGGDLNDDGVVDQADADIEVNMLDLWESPGTSGSWAPIWAEHSLTDDWFKAGVGHFSGFAVAY